MFIKDYSSITAELRKLLHKHTKWEWNEKHQQSFEILKNSLKDNCMLNYFDPNLKTEVICDASPYDLDLRCFSKIFNELSIVKGLIVRGNRIYIPDSLRKF